MLQHRIKLGRSRERATLQRLVGDPWTSDPGDFDEVRKATRQTMGARCRGNV